MTRRAKGGTLDAATVKAAATGRWVEILAAAGIPADLLDGKGHPCPRCGGDDRFAAHKDMAERGAVICRKCFAKDGGDGLATVAWIRGTPFPEAVRWVAEYLGISTAPTGNGKPRIVARYKYRDAQGDLRYQVVRYEPKDFKQQRPKPGGGWIWDMQGVEALPYRLPELLADPSRAVVVCEGEKDCDNLTRIGVIATTNHGGAGKWTAAHAQHLAGRRVVILPDNDEPGERHAQLVAASLRGIAASVRVVRLPNLPPKGDASEWIAAGGTRDQLRELANATPEWTPEAPPVNPTTPAEWPELDRLDERELPEFPLSVLPDTLRLWVAAESHATQTPADLPGLLSIAVVASCIARHVEIEARAGWREPANLYVAVLLDPGNRKSAVYADAIRPLTEVEAALIDMARPRVAREQSERRQAQKQLERAEKLAAEKGDAAKRDTALDLAEKLATWPEPVLPRLIVDDATSEKLGMLLAEQGGRIASMSPEGGVFDLMAGMYSKSGMPQFGVYLMAHAGDELRVDRVSRKSVHIERPALTCAYAIQPQVIEGLADNVAFRGRGLLGRFLYAAPRSWIGRRRIAPEAVPSGVASDYADQVRRLASDPPQGTLTLQPAAGGVFCDWEAEIEAMLADGGDLEGIRDWGGKLAGATLRLAAVLHCAAGRVLGAGIDADTVRAAIAIGRYLIPHAEAVLTMMQAKDDTAADEARYVLRWMLRHNRREFTKREAYQDCKHRFPTVDGIDAALSELIRRGYIRLRPPEVGKPGRPPSPEFQVNPAVFDSRNPEIHPQYPQNSVAGRDGASSGDCGDEIRHSENKKRKRVMI